MAVDAELLKQRIDAFPRWHYQFDFGDGVLTPLADPAEANRHEQRRRYFFDALVRLHGGSLQGKRVLDLGCNAGFWSLQAIEAGADFILGVDGRQMHVEQAELVFEAKGVDRSRYRFEEANIFTHDFAEKFDIVLCLGLMYHISKPFELFELFDGVDASVVVIDTSVSFAPGGYFQVSPLDRDLDDPRNAIDYEIVLVPTRGAIAELGAHFGYDTVPLAHNMSDYTGMRDYEIRRRLAFICGRGLSLDMLQREPAPPVTPWWRALLNPSRRGWQRPPN